MYPEVAPVAVREASVVGVVVSVAFASARDDDDDDDDDDDAEGPPDHLGCSFDTIVESSSSSFFAFVSSSWLDNALLPVTAILFFFFGFVFSFVSIKARRIFLPPR